jgi:GNAT superfamily N-acetyltransferase
MYFDKIGDEVGYIEYKPENGKICLFFITNPSYRNRGLGKQILDLVIDDFKKHNTKRAWLVTANCPHKFWESNGFTYTKTPDNSVISHGYTRDL